MPIDGCPHDFKALGAEILPKRMSDLRRAMLSPYEASLFRSPGRGVKGILRATSHARDFGGLYVLLEDGRPVYVGISRRVVARLREHFTGKTHFDASLVYAMAHKKWKGNGRRGELMKNDAFRKEFVGAQERLAKYKVVIRSLGGSDVRIVPRGLDKGADILASFRLATTFTFTLAVQAKHYQSKPPVGPDVVDQVVKGMDAEGATLGWVVTSGTFSKEAEDRKAKWEEERGFLLALIDGDQLAALIVEGGLKSTALPANQGGGSAEA